MAARRGNRATRACCPSTRPNRTPSGATIRTTSSNARAIPTMSGSRITSGSTYSNDGAKSWTKVSRPEQGVHFGFPITADAKSGSTAWVVPGKSDMERIAVGGALVVARTTDGGATWQELRRGLPQELSFDVVYRHALANKAGAVAFGTTTGNLYVSDDGGEGWTTVANNLPPIYSVRFAREGAGSAGALVFKLALALDLACIDDRPGERAFSSGRSSPPRCAAAPRCGRGARSRPPVCAPRRRRSTDVERTEYRIFHELVGCRWEHRGNERAAAQGSQDAADLGRGDDRHDDDARGLR